MDCWHILGIAPTRDEAAIKRAYAQLLKKHRPDRDPDGFIRLREAYEMALAGGEQYNTFADDTAGGTAGCARVAPQLAAGEKR